jgi:phenacrylate decarboxylase
MRATVTRFAHWRATNGGQSLGASAPRRIRVPVRCKHTAAKAPGPDPVEAQVDFRTFIDLLRHDGDLVDIQQEIDPHLEVGAIIRRVSETNDKAPLFSNIKGAKNGVWRMFGNAASLRSDEKERYGRIARTLGLPPDATWKDICARTQAAKHLKPMPNRVVETGPCKENKIFGDDVDLHSLPAPFLHMRDGGKYLQTYGVNVLSTPDNSWTNWSIFRGMIHDKNRLVCLVGSGQHNKLIRQEWEKLGATEMPWACALGVPPAANLAAALPLPKNVSESEYIGALVGKPLDVVKCETNDLLVPASSEIVLEGTTSLVERVHEGPFEDFMGLVFEGEGQLMPTFTVKAITYRNNPILPVSVPGRITDESVSCRRGPAVFP